MVRPFVREIESAPPPPVLDSSCESSYHGYVETYIVAVIFKIKYVSELFNLDLPLFISPKILPPNPAQLIKPDVYEL